jgi:Domain of unknown function (DUF5010)/Carbohydrate binding module (family 35)
MRYRKEQKTRLVTAVGVLSLVALLVALSGAFPTTLSAAPTTLLDETFDNGNNWNQAAGTWQVEAGRYTNCIAAPCPNGLTRAWAGVASNARSYVIDADIYMIGSAEECKLIYTGANNNEDFRVDIRRGAPGQVRLTNPGGTDQVLATTVTGNGTPYHLTVTVSRASVTVLYRKESEAAITIGPITTSIYPDGKIGVGTFNGDCDFDNVVVVGEAGLGNGGTSNAKLIPVFGYERTEACDEGPYNPLKGEELTELECDRPLFTPWNRDEQAWWNTMVEEMDYAGISIVGAHNRGCHQPVVPEPIDPLLHGFGDMCPRQLTKLIDAIDSRSSPLKIAMFDDFAVLGEQFHELEGHNFDVNSVDGWNTHMWNERWKLFYDTIDAPHRATIDGRPLIFIWTPGPYMDDTQGHLSEMLDWLRAKTQEVFGFNPFVVVTDGFYAADTTLPGHVDAIYSWFQPVWALGPNDSNTLTKVTHNGHTGATVVPAFRSFESNTGPGCAAPCRELWRNHGNTAISGLDTQKNTEFVLLEGWTNVVESAGWYRNLEGNDPDNCTQAGEENTLDFPNQMLNIVRRYAIPVTGSVTLEAETADEYADTTNGNSGGAYRFTEDPAAPEDPLCGTNIYNDLDVYGDGNAYHVGSIAAGEWLKWRDLYLSASNYTITIRYATPNPNSATACFQVNSASLNCSNFLPATGGWTTWANYAFTTGVSLKQGLSNWRFSFPNGGLNIDKITIVGPVGGGD